MPEGDTIHRTATVLRRWLVGREVTAVRSRVAGLVTVGLVGSTVTEVESKGKHLLVRFSGGRTLHTHMRMSGSWHVYRAGERWQRPGHQARVVVEAGERVAVCFNAPVVEMVPTRAEGLHPVLASLGPDLLGPGPLDGPAARARARRAVGGGPGGAGTPTVGEVLLDQRVVAGIGNIYRCEALFLCGVDPWALVAALADTDLDELLATAARLLRVGAGMGPTQRSGSPESSRGRPWVYRRGGLPCRRCGTPIGQARLGDQARTVYWCPRCQPAAGSGASATAGRPGTVGRVVTVEEATGATDELVAAFARLLPQLSQSSAPPGPAELAEMIASPATTVFVARGDDGVILGSLTLAMFRIPTGVRAWIEDVVVDDAARGQGVGGALTRAALAKAGQAGARTVELTSRASRVAANQLYQRLGFAARETNVYRYQLPV